MVAAPGVQTGEEVVPTEALFVGDDFPLIRIVGQTPPFQELEGKYMEPAGVARPPVASSCDRDSDRTTRRSLQLL